MTAPATAHGWSAAPREQIREPRLRLVAPAPTSAPKLPFVVVVVAILVVGLLSLLMLNTLAAQDAFRLHDLQRQSGTLTDREQQMRLALDRQSAPSTLAAQARALGMSPAESPAFLRLRDGRVVGVASAAPTPAPVTPSPVTPATESAARPGKNGHHSTSALPRNRGASHSGRTPSRWRKPAPATSPAG